MIAIVAGKYDPLGRWLSELDDASAVVELTFADLETLVGPLPPSARTHRTWWGNSSRHPHAAVWLHAGWRIEDVFLERGLVSFVHGEPTRRPGGGRATVLDGTAALIELVDRAGWSSLEAVVAANTVFLQPDTVAQAGAGALFPVVRDPNRRGQFGQLPDGQRVLFDDNTTPTAAFLWAANRIKGPDVQFNHIWARPRDPESYTALWNLCCTPAFLAKTSDTHPGTRALLQYRAWELYGHRPAGEPEPQRPATFTDDLVWAPMPDSVADLEALLRQRLIAAPAHRATIVARSIGWRFSTGPDTAL